MQYNAKIKLIAMDMDGTLLNAAHQISPRNQKALKAAADMGVTIAICSGRLAGDSGLFALDAGLDSCRILSLNGAYCLDKPNGKPYAEHRLPHETTAECLRVLNELGATYGCFVENRMVAVIGNGQKLVGYWGTHHDREGAPQYLSGDTALQEAVSGGISKIVYKENRSASRMETVRRTLEPLPGLDITSSGEENLEFMPKGVNKGSAIRELTERLGLLPENVMTIGDYDNDIPMLTYAGLGVAMGNASEAVKKIAQQTTLSNEEDGVGAAIERFVLCGA